MPDPIMPGSFKERTVSGYTQIQPHTRTSGQKAMIKILIADDHAIVRAGLKQFLTGQTDMEVAGEAETGKQVLEMIRSNDYDVVLLDISMPDQNGVDILRRLKRIKPDLPVLILSGFPENQYAVNLIRAGASGYLTKEGPPEELLKAVRIASQGNKYVSPGFAQIMFNDLVTDQGERPIHTTLSEREFQIFCKLSAGTAVSRIAEELNLSVKTISTYRARVLEKMNMKSNAELTSYAIRNRLIE
jgi:two-component system invasion response regulator UvrY